MTTRQNVGAVFESLFHWSRDTLDPLLENKSAALSCLLALTIFVSINPEIHHIALFAHMDSSDYRPSGVQELDQIIQGRGTLWIGNRGERLNQIRVVLGRGGEAEVYLDGDNKYLTLSFNGRWSSRKDEFVDLEINESFGIAGAHGRGRIYFRDGKLEKMEVNGIIPRYDRFSAYFRAGKRYSASTYRN